MRGLLAGWMWMVGFHGMAFGDGGIGCIRQLTIPRHGPSALSAGPSEEIRVTVTVGAKGDASQVRYRGGEVGHHLDIEIGLSESRFDPACKGQTVILVFQYAIEGAVDNKRKPFVRFYPPNKWVLVNNPETPNIFRTP